ncbi:phage major capsid protein [Streptomyces chiangmaiensis]|uniref:Phage major capsid protein n=1 Tax=Streptomyces chiangmaiensis TaxID=766497 RepID=A0ABU7FTJ1_9ACTN|nr:phage major capsid protein [Streptomyces chiangmaiensis]MED7826803.1 phage major capsid protein [Streptomyces chiangmaiensis]
MSQVLAELKVRREKVYQESMALAEKAASEARHFSEDEERRWQDHQTALDALDERIGELKDQEQRAQDAAAAMDRLRGGTPSGPATRSWLPGLAEFRELQTEQRAVGTLGAFIPVQYANTYFDLLRKRTAVLDAGPVILPVQGAGSVKVPKVTSAVTIAGLAENTAITPADPSLSDITLDPKKFAAMTLIAREAIEDSQPELRQVVANSLLRDMAVELDRQLVTGDGTGQNLRGLRNTTGATAGPSTGTNGGALTFAFLADTMAAYDGANLDPDRSAWIMHSRTWSSVRKLVDSQQRPIVSIDPTQGVRPTLWGRPVYISNSLSITETTGTSTDCSSIILADMSQVVVAVARQVELQVDESFAFNADQVAVRVTCRYDIGVPQPTAVVLTTGVRP